MGKGSASSSSSSNTTSTTTQDNKVSATDNAIALGNQASFQYTDQFSDNVRTAFEEILQLARDVGQTAIEFANKAVETNEKAVEQVAQRAQNAEENANLKDQIIVKNLIPYIGIALIALSLTISGGKAKKK